MYLLADRYREKQGQESDSKLKNPQLGRIRKWILFESVKKLSLFHSQMPALLSEPRTPKQIKEIEKQCQSKQNNLALCCDGESKGRKEVFQLKQSHFCFLNQSMKKKNTQEHYNLMIK